MTKAERQEQLERLLLELLPANGSTVATSQLLTQWTQAASEAGLRANPDDFASVREAMVSRGLIVKGKGRGGSTARASAAAPGSEAFALEGQDPAAEGGAGEAETKRKPTARKPKLRAADADEAAQVLSYRHADRRKNNPEVGLVSEASDPQQPKKEWAYNPHLDPVLNFDSARAELENMIDDALTEGGESSQQQLGEIVAWLDHALAGSDEAAVREVVANLRKRLTGKPTQPPERKALEVDGVNQDGR